MTIPRALQGQFTRVADLVRSLVPGVRGPAMLTQDEAQLGVFLRGNGPLYDALRGIIEARIEGRLSLPEPSDPLVCKSMLARDRECQLLLLRLELIYRGPAPSADEGEPPAA